MPEIHGLENARLSGKIIFDALGYEWYYYAGKIRMTESAIERPSEQRENGYWCSWLEARNLLEEFGYL